MRLSALRRLRGLALLAGVLALGSWWSLRDGPEDAVLTSARSLAAAFAAPPDRTYELVIAHAADPVQIVAAGSRKKLAASEAARLAQTRRRVEGPRLLSLEDPRVTIDSRRAQLDAILISSESQPGDLHAEARRVTAEFEQSDRWRLSALRLGPTSKHIPEARP